MLGLSRNRFHSFSGAMVQHVAFEQSTRHGGDQHRPDPGQLCCADARARGVAAIELLPARLRSRLHQACAIHGRWPLGRCRSRPVRRTECGASDIPSREGHAGRTPNARRTAHRPARISQMAGRIRSLASAATAKPFQASVCSNWS